VLGHVDSGKTAICRILSEVASTASLDKNPQSQERGITLDLGFSAFFTRVPVRFEEKVKEEYLQFTLVDCPGHASLIKTIIGGAQIIDIMFLVIDATKGIQAQTAECIIIAELFMKKIVVVLNKVDLV
jgi:selenocysteine-specific elongation factor